MNELEKKELALKQYQEAIVRNMDAIHRQEENRQSYERQQAQIKDMRRDADRVRERMRKERDLKVKHRLRQKLDRKIEAINNFRQSMRVYNPNPAISSEQSRIAKDKIKMEELKWEVADEKNHEKIYQQMQYEIKYENKPIGKALFDAEQRAGKFDRAKGIKDFRIFMDKHHPKMDGMELGQHRQEMVDWLNGKTPKKAKSKDEKKFNSQTAENLNKVKMMQKNKVSADQITQGIEKKAEARQKGRER